MIQHSLNTCRVANGCKYEFTSLVTLELAQVNAPISGYAALLEKRLKRQSLVINKLKKEKKHLSLKNWRLKRQLVMAKQCYKDELAKLRDETFAVRRAGNNPRGWLSPQGNISLAIRRNIGNIACSLIGHTILQDISASTVSRAECRSAAALVASTRGFYQRLGRGRCLCIFLLCSLDKQQAQLKLLQLTNSTGRD